MGYGISAATVRAIVQEEVGNQTDKLAGEAPGEASVIALWNSGVATSGEAGADLVSIGVAADRKKLNLLEVDISRLREPPGLSVLTRMLSRSLMARWRLREFSE